MVNYSFKETINYFSKKLNSTPDQEDLESGELELILNGVEIILKKGSQGGEFQIVINLGAFITVPKTDVLSNLAAANFLGIDTGGCVLCLGQDGKTLNLKTVSSASTTPQQNWEGLCRIVGVAAAWLDILEKKEDFAVLAHFETSQQTMPALTDSSLKV